MAGASLVAGTSPTLRAAPPDGSDAKGVEFFERKIRPLLANTCYQCHSRQSKKVKGGLLLDSQEGLLKGGDSGPIFVTGDPDQSLLIKAVRYKDEDLRMPPDGKKLTGAQVADLEAWVKMGAPLPGAGAQEDKIKASARTHWAFQPVKRPAIPTVKNRRWVQSPVDAFILAKLEPAGMQPAQPADKRTLIRRATYDLIGLPPTPEEVAAFVADESPDAFATVVDRLLASRHYGERWGRHWLDVARYASTDSPYAFTYRDYVIRAFNDDLPYDQFLLQQLAADQLDLGKNKQALAGLGFLTCGRQFENNIHDTIDDRIDAVTRGMMALSVSCARCHDHKYDPIPTRDYYALHGVFASSVEPDELPVLGIAPDPKAYAEYLSKRKPLQAKWDNFIRKQEAQVLKQHRQQTAQYLLLSREPTKLAELDRRGFRVERPENTADRRHALAEGAGKTGPGIRSDFRSLVRVCGAADFGIRRPGQGIVGQNRGQFPGPSRELSGGPGFCRRTTGLLEGCGAVLRQTVRGGGQTMAREAAKRCQKPGPARTSSRKRYARCSTARTAPVTCRPS